MAFIKRSYLTETQESENFKVLNFGLVCSGKKYTNIFNLPGVRKIYSVGRTLSPNIVLDQVFNIKTGKKSGDVEVHFTPPLPFQKYCDYYTILSEVNGRSQEYILNVLGETEGPCVTCANNNLVFLFTHTDIKAKKNGIKLNNSSKYEAKFHFDIDPEHSNITVSPSSGVVPAKGKFLIIISFTPSKQIVYYKKLTCLFEHQEPIAVNIRALKVKTEMNVNIDEYFNFVRPSPEYANGYQAYFDDSFQTRTNIEPVVSLNKTCVDMGHISILDVQDKNGTALIAKNNSTDCLRLSWNLGSQTEFIISPTSSSIEPGFNKIFFVSFKPKIADRFYATELEGIISWGNNFQFVMPTSLSVRLIGSTFGKGSNSWDPLYKIKPRKIHIPATAPSVPTFSTMTIERKGNLPLLFKFIPPECSCYTVKPMQGLIRDQFQIIIIRLIPGVETDVECAEKWSLLFNTSLQAETIEMLGSAELPVLKIGNNSEVSFPVTCPRFYEEVKVPIWNPTRHTLKLNIGGVNETFLTNRYEEEIRPNQQLLKYFKFCPSKVGVFRVTLRFFVSYAQDRFKLLEDNTEILVVFNGQSKREDISVVPTELDLGDTIYGQSKWGEFCIENMGVCKVPITLYCVPRCLGSRTGRVVIKPTSFTVKPKSEKLVSIRVSPDEPGLQFLCILWRVTVTPNDEKGLLKKLLNINIYCSIPSIEIIDLKTIGNGRALSKLNYWKLLQINSLNSTLKRMTPGSEDTITLKIPIIELVSNQLTVQFLLKNPTDIAVKLSIHWVKNCECKPVNEQAGISLRKWVTHCPHKREVEISPNERIIEPHGRSVIFLNIRDVLLEMSTYIYRLEVASVSIPEVKSTLNLHITKDRSPGSPKVIILENITDMTVSKTLLPVYVGDPDPPIQVIWLYNGSKKDVHYELEGYSSGVFHCHNPTGVVQTLKTHPICITFKPFEYQTSEAIANLYFGNVNYNIVLRAVGATQYESKILVMLDKMPVRTLFKPLLGMAQLSMDHLLLDVVETHSTAKRCFYLMNNTDESITYNFSELYIKDVMHMKVYPALGILKGKEILACLLKVETFSCPAKLSCPLSCKIVRYFTPKELNEKRKDIKNVSLTFENLFTSNINKEETKFQGTGFPKKYKKLVEYLVLAVSIFIQGEINIDYLRTLDDQMRYKAGLPLTEPILEPVPSPLEASVCINVLSRCIWNLLNSPWGKSWLETKQEEIYYKDIGHETSTLPIIKAPKRFTEDFLNQTIFSIMTDLFSGTRE